MELTNISKKQKIFLIVMAIAISLLAIGGFALAFFVNYNSLSPSVPVVLDDGSNIFITTSLNENCDHYQFVFEKGEARIEISTKSNMLSLNEMLENEVQIGQTYKVSVCYVGQDKMKTDYSKSLSWLCQTYLDQPTVEVDGTKIKWQPVENADEYKVHIKQGEEFATETTASCEYDFSNLAGGDIEFYVVALSNNIGYKDSKDSSAVSVVHTYKLQAFESATLDQSSKLITVTAREEIEYVRVICEGIEYVVKPVRTSAHNYVYTISLKTIYESGNSVAIAPYSTDVHTVFEGDLLYI